jgi:hypothetical protein
MQDFRVQSGIQANGNITGVNYLNASNITVTYTGLFANIFVSGKIIGNVIGTVSSLDNQTTSALKEGSNLYFTAQRAIEALAGNNVTVNNLTVSGDLDIQGNIVSVNTATLNVEDKNILIANGAINAGQADGAGITIAGANATIIYQSSPNRFELNKNVKILGNVTGDTVNANTITSNAFVSTGDISAAGNLIANGLIIRNIVVSDNVLTGNVTSQGINTNVISTTDITTGNINVTGTSNAANNQATGSLNVPNGGAYIGGNLVVAGSAFVGKDPVVTLNPLNQSIALLRAQMDAPAGNVLYVATNGNDNNSGNSLANALANIHIALNRANSWTTVFVKSGEYTLYQQPVTIKKRVGLVGDNLRTTTIRPSNVTQDMFYVNNACYVTGFTFRDHLSPAAVFSYNPDGSAGFISTSPYIQNSSSITTTGTGMRVDGNYVSGLRSMVCDSYTNTNEGGIGIHMLNRGYTQLVSVFTICCDIAILAENGGFCSITNSNASFGRLGLLARGVSQPLNFGKFGQITETDEGTRYLITNLDSKPNYGDAVLFANYDQAKCSRDTGLIVDSLAFDLAYQSNTQSAFAGLQYWAQSSSAIPNQAEQTIAAFTYAKNLATNVAVNTTITSPRQANVTQISGTAGAWVSRISDGFDLVANIITGGTVGVTDRIIPNQFPANTNVAVNNAANLVLLNKSFIQKEVIAYVNQTYPGFFANANNFINAANAITKCERDTGYLLDSIIFDFIHGGNRQAITSGVYYYNNDFTITQIADQVPQTTAAYDFIGTIIDDIVRNKKVAGYNQEKCERDTGLIVDSLAFDLGYNSNTQSNFAGLQYWSQTSSAIPNQSAETIAAINFAKQLASNIAIGNYAGLVMPGTPRQANVSLNSYSLPFSGPELGIESAKVNTDFDLISNIITGGTVGVSDRIIPNRFPANTNVVVSNVANAIIINKGYIQAETIAFVNQTYPGFFANANNFIDVANAQAKCSRDVGSILDGVVFDLRHDGNRQSIQSGVYYYNFSANTTQINEQIVQTGAAYNFIGSIIDEVIRCVPITGARQSVYTQNTTAATAATLVEANIVLQKINLITNIITNGPNVAQPKVALSGNVLTISANVSNAVKLILANKDFIKAETIEFVNATLFDPPYQSAIKQNTTAFAAASIAEANLILNDINLITNIITIGANAAPTKSPISYSTLSNNTNVINATKIILANKDFIVAEVNGYINRNWANISNGAVAFYTVANSTPLVSNTSLVTLLEGVADINILANATVSFHQPSYISALGYTFEYIGSGTNIQTALPYNGGFPIQDNEVTEEKGGRVYFTSTDQQGDFRIGQNLVFNRVDGTISGRTFTKALFSVMTPYILAIEG